jgi:sugar/nucleoside kinase (ribokinase family)
MTLVHVGSVVVDLLAAVPALPPRGGDVVASSLAPTPGGGFNIMVAAARQGVPVAYAGPHGTGPFGDLVRDALRGAGIAVTGRQRVIDTGLVVALVDADGERTFVTAPAAVVGPTSADLAAVPVRPGDVVSVSGYGLLHPRSRDSLVPWVLALPRDVAVVLDPGPLAPPEAVEALLPRVDWFTANLTEARALLDGDPGTVDAAAALVHRAGSVVVVRDGAAGCAVAADGLPAVAVPGFAVRAVDTTGAGDAHTGVLVAALAAGADPVTAARRGNAAGALAVTRRGPATAPTREELDAFLAERPRSAS